MTQQAVVVHENGHQAQGFATVGVKSRRLTTSQ